jgi:hypothetical protein
MAALHFVRSMRSERGLILRIEVAKASEPARGGHALIKGCETAIRAAAGRSLAVDRAPRIVLCLGTISKADDTEANSQHEQQEPHSSLRVLAHGWQMPALMF